MKNSTQGYNDQIGCVSQKKLSFYEENYILEPEDDTIDKGYFLFEGEIDTEVDNPSYHTVA